MDEIIYFKVTLDDLQTVVNLRLIFAIEFFGQQTLEAIQDFKKYNQEYLQRSIQNNSFIAYLAKYGNEIAGIGGMVLREQPGNFKNPTGKVGYIFNMYTFPPFRRRGICSEILRLLLEEAGRMGIVVLNYTHPNKENLFINKMVLKSTMSPHTENIIPTSFKLF